MAKVNVTPLIAANQRRWDNMKINPGRVSLIDRVARRLIQPSAKLQYKELERLTGVPWFIIAVIHEREASQRWDRSIAQGDPWNRISTHVPKGRGPFSSFKLAALDALQKCAPYAARWKVWTAGGALALNEMYNGLGYFRKGRPSPYNFAWTNQYVRGKYVADGQYDPNHVDTQLGCAAIILRMQELDADVRFKKDGKKAEASGSVTSAGGAAVEATRQTAETVDASHVDAAKELVTSGFHIGRVLIIVGIAIAAGLLAWGVVRFVKNNRPRLVTADPEARVAGSERIESKEDAS